MYGTMKMSFIVDEYGNFSEPTVIHNDLSQFGNVFKNFIGNNKPMIPGTVNGKPAKFIGILELNYENFRPRIYWTPILKDLLNGSK